MFEFIIIIIFALLYASLLFVPSVFIGQEITYRLTGRDGWALSEPLIGALVFGLGVALWIL